MDNSEKDLFSGLRFDLSPEHLDLASHNDSYQLGPDLTDPQKNSPLHEATLDPFHFEKPPAILPLNLARLVFCPSPAPVPNAGCPAPVQNSHMVLPEAQLPLDADYGRSTRGRGRKRRSRFVHPDPYTEMQMAVIRAQNNRRFAKESRERKKRRLLELENEVDRLRFELDQYRSRMARYELIERHRSMLGNEMPIMLSEAFQEMEQARLDRAELPKVAIRHMEKYAEERRQAMEQLVRLMVEMTVPFPIRLCVWEAENNIDVFDIPRVAQYMKYTPEEILAAGTHMRSMFPERKKYEEIRQFLLEESQKIRKSVRQLLECHKTVQLENKKLWQYMRKNFVPRYNFDSAEFDMKTVLGLAERPELSDYAIYGINDEDFQTGSTCCDDIDEESAIFH